MKSVGDVLRKTRESKKLSRADIARQTYIDEKYLEAIENNRFSEIGSTASVVGFVSLYAKVLELDAQTLVALLRRDFALTPSSIRVPSSKRMHILRQRRQLLINWVTIIGITVLVIGGYAVWSVARLHQPPELSISSPDDGSTVPPLFIVRGKTDSDALVEVDAQPVALTQDGEFARELELSEGKHTITVIAKNRRGAETIRQVTVEVQNP